MTLQFLQIVGIIGNMLLVAAYWPQIYKILKTKKAQHLSIGMWWCNFLGDLALLIYSLWQHDAIITILFAFFFIENLTVMILTYKYGTKKAL